MDSDVECRRTLFFLLFKRNNSKIKVLDTSRKVIYYQGGTDNGKGTDCNKTYGSDS